MIIDLSPASIADYRLFKSVKRLPVWTIRGRQAWFPDEYAESLGFAPTIPPTAGISLSDSLWDYQRDISRLAIEREKFCCFCDCGLGKTRIMFEFVKHAAMTDRMLIVSPLMVIRQTLSERDRFCPDLQIEQVAARDLAEWMQHGSRIGITNYESIRPELERGTVGGIVCDESSCLKSHYGKWGTKLIDLGRGMRWKLCLTGTPAPNDRIEYANHAVFMDAFPTVNSFLATYFINRGQTQERWMLKDHALPAFYRALSHWAIFLTDPATYGWKDNCETLPPIHVHIEDVPLTSQQTAAIRKHTGKLFATDIGGIAERGKLSQIAKGNTKDGAISTNKPAYIRDMLKRWREESTLIWCRYNAEQKSLEHAIPEAASISGDTPNDERQRIIEDFKSGRIKTLLSKPRILGFGLNLQIATRQIFSGISDSYEEYYQAVKRSNRYGSTRPLNVHIPITEVEEPFVCNVLRKAKMVEADTRTQEKIFREFGHAWKR